MKNAIIGKTVHHKKYGDGTITHVFENGNIKVSFNGAEKALAVPRAFREGILSSSDPEVQKYADARVEAESETREDAAAEAARKRVIFCNIMWAERYDDRAVDGVNGGKWIDEHGTGNESANFCPIDIIESGKTQTRMLGSYETKCTSGETINQTHIEKINGCDAMRKADYVDGVTVIWCATPPEGGCRVVGWYKNARVYREYQKIAIDEDDGSTWERWYNISCAAEDAVLLSIEERAESKWSVPRKPRDPIGFYQANNWYAREPEAQNFVQNMLRYIDNHV